MCVLAPPPAHRVEQKATFSQNQPNDLKLMALTVVPTNTPAMLEHGFKLCIFVGVACRYLLQDHSEPPQRNELSPKSSQSETVLRRKMFNWSSRNSQTSLSVFIDHRAFDTCIHCLSWLFLLYTSPVGEVYSPVSLTSYMESCAAALMIIMFL